MGKELQNEIEKQLQFALEEERLKDTINIINDEILKCIDKRKQITEMILEYRKNILEEYKDDEDKIIEYFDHESYIKEESFKSTDKKLKELTILKSSPYFGKVTFREDDYGIEDIYIGRFGVTLEDSFEPLIVDWRAPISAIFYNGIGEQGKYNAPDGEIEVSILNRLQYIIKKEKLQGVFNSAIDIKDEILQMVLSKNSSDKLKDIVMTIQKEQDEIIREDKNKIIVVDGVAGSGKTTIALHRVAYLIYNYRKLLENKVLILGPNRIFIDYISNVLPTLGETGVFQTTFLDLALELVDVDDAMDIKVVMERILSGDKEFEEKIAYKRSDLFKQDLDNVINDLEINAYKGRNFMFMGNEILSKDEIDKMFEVDFKALPLFRRSKKIKRILFLKLKDARDCIFRQIQEDVEKEKASLTKEELILQENNIEFKRRIRVRELIKEVIKAKKELQYLDEKNIEELYFDFIKEHEYTEEDLVGILYLKIKLQGLKLAREIKHLVIDEAQDYYKLQFEVLKELTNIKSMTIVGDSNQQIIPNKGASPLATLKEVFNEEDVESFKLNKSYRSTAEIMQYSNKYINDTSIVPMVREGAPVEEKMCSPEETVSNIIVATNDMKKSGLENIAIIVKNLDEAKKIYELLKDQIVVKLMDRDNIHIGEGILVIPSYYAKGLEFDGAIVVDDESNNNNKNMMYVMCTRALHKLIVVKNV